MGFFGDLFKKTAKNLVSDVVEDLMDGRGNSQTVRTVSAPVAGNGSNDKRTASGESELRKRLEAEFATNYSDCDVRQEINPSVVDAPVGAEPFHYGLYKAGEPVAFFMIITRDDHYAKSSVRKAASAAEQRGIPCMNFYSHLPNTPEYIEERLAENIKR